MKLLKTDYRELKEGIYQLKAMNSKGEYANINVNTGMIIYCKKVCSMPMDASKINIKDFEKELSKNNIKWLAKNYIEWRKKYPEVYNKMLDRINNLELVLA